MTPGPACQGFEKPLQAIMSKTKARPRPKIVKAEARRACLKNKTGLQDCTNTKFNIWGKCARSSLPKNKSEDDAKN